MHQLKHFNQLLNQHQLNKEQHYRHQLYYQHPHKHQLNQHNLKYSRIPIVS